MPRRLSSERWLLAASALSAWTCGIADLDVTGKNCPCPSGYSCDPVTDTCRRAASPDGGGDAAADANAEASPDGSSDSPTSCPSVDVSEPITIASGRHHVCVIRSGELWCWGNNDNGQLGLGHTTASSTPARVGTASDWKSVAALNFHTCATNTSTNLYCWGDNSVGQIGVGSVEPQLEPVIVDLNRNWEQPAAGEGISCAITPERQLFCWGTDNGGAAGTGQATGVQSTPYPVNATLEVAHVGTGSYNGCAVATDGGLYCWGQMDCYKNGATTNVLTPTKVGDGCWRRSAGGHRHTCAIDHEGKLFCWGDNDLGALGIGVVGQGESDGVMCFDAYLEPQPVAVDERFVSVAASYLGSCAISEDHELFCWGFNESSRISPTPGSVLVPTRIGSDADWAEAAPGMFHVCAKKLDGRVFCMGGTGDIGPASGPLSEVTF